MLNFPAKSFIVIILIIAMLSITLARPHGDLVPAASGSDEFGRVQIKVYRGPSEDHDHAPWGFWVKQPAEDDHHY